MAYEEALRAIDQSWPTIKPRLMVRELATLANIEHEPAVRRADLPETIFRLVEPALPPKHEARSAVHSPSGRFEPGWRPIISLDEVIDRCIDRARVALTSPSIADDAAADSLSDAAIREIIQAGVIEAGELSDDVAVLTVEYEGRRYHPQFQFATIEPATVHPIVGSVNERLGGDEDPVGAISWWLTPNTWLGESPAQLLGSDRDADIDYAADQLANDNW